MNSGVFLPPFVFQNMSLKVFNFYACVPQIISMRYGFSEVKIKIQSVLSLGMCLVPHSIHCVI